MKDYRLEQSEPPQFSVCPICRQDIYVGESYYLIDGESICTECIIDHLEQYKEVAI